MFQSVRYLWRMSRFSKANTLARTTSIEFTNAFHTDYNSTREEQVFKLVDGRTVGFAEYGNPEGTPAFFLHGSPGCRHDGSGYTGIGKKHNIRIICPDRPGYGKSSPNPRRSLSEYANDISQLAKHLSIPKYHVFGMSGGGPYVLACAYGSPKDELLNAVVIASMGHPDVLTIRHDGWYTFLVLRMTKWAPGLMRYSVKRLMANEEALDQSLRLSLNLLMSGEDKEVISTPKAKAEVKQLIKEAYAQGAEGAIRDGQLYIGPWDFELKDIHRHVMLFFGLKDSRVPRIVGRHFKKHLPNAELIEYEDMGHVIPKYDEEILMRMIGTWDSNSSPKLEERVE